MVPIQVAALSPERQRLLRSYVSEVYQFGLTWCVLAGEGKCDEIGGVQWRRCLAEWIAGGMVLTPAQHIIKAANQSPFDPPPTCGDVACGDGV